MPGAVVATVDKAISSKVKNPASDESMSRDPGSINLFVLKKTCILKQYSIGLTVQVQKLGAVGLKAFNVDRDRRSNRVWRAVHIAPKLYCGSFHSSIQQQRKAQQATLLGFEASFGLIDRNSWVYVIW